MKLIYARYNKYQNSIDVTTFNVTPNSQCALNALAIDEPIDCCI